MASVQPTGEVTVGIDRTGKHYMYEKGKGAGRQPLNLPDDVSQSLAQAGMAPGSPLHLSGAQAQQLQQYKTNKGKGKPVKDVGSLSKYFTGQNAWVQSQGDPNQRLDVLASDDRMDMLRGPKSKEGQVISAMVMSTILGREVAYKDVDESKYKLVFNLGTDTRAGYIKIKQGGKELYRMEFKSPKDLSAEDIQHFRDTFSSLKAQEHIEGVMSKVDTSLKTSGLDPDTQSYYRSAMVAATQDMGERAAQLIRDNITQFHFYNTSKDLTGAMTEKPPDKGQVLGFFRIGSGGIKGSIHLDGRDSKGRAEYYAHELFHAVDCIQKDGWSISSAREFQRAWKEEGHLVSNYATKSQYEGFAEFGRLVQCGGYSHEELHQKFPKTAAFFEAEGLLAPNLKSRVDRVPTPLPPVFGEPIVTPTSIGDGPLDTSNIGTLTKGGTAHYDPLDTSNIVIPKRTPKVIRPADPTQPPTPEPNPEMPPTPTPPPTGQEPVRKRKAKEPKAKKVK